MFNGCSCPRRGSRLPQHLLLNVLFIASLFLLLPFSSTALAGYLTLEWEAPSTNVDGTPLTDLATYRIYYATASGPCAGSAYRELASPLPNPPAGTLVSHALTGLTTGTTYFVQVSAIDGSGNESACSNEASGAAKTETADTTAPTGSISINERAAATAWTAATLNLAATDAVGVTGYYVSTSATPPTAGAAGWGAVPATTSYAANVAFTLPTGDGSKTVYAWYKDAAGKVSARYSDSILLDTTPPTDGTLTGTSGDQQVALSWAGFADGGSGLARAKTYTLVFQTSSLPSATCSNGTKIYEGTGSSYTHTGRTNGTTYYYRLCAKDHVGNTSTGAPVTATANPPVWVSVTKQGKGQGRITSAPIGITCGADCTERYPSSSLVTLRAAPEPGSVFAGWSGACTGTGACVVVLTAMQALRVTATFSRAYPFTDEVLVPGETPVRMVHLSDLRAAVNTARSDYGLTPARWTDPTLIPGVTEVKRVHLTELRTALSQVYAAAGLGTPRFSDPTLQPAETPIKAPHLSELRTLLRALP